MKFLTLVAGMSKGVARCWSGNYVTRFLSFQLLTVAPLVCWSPSERLVSDSPKHYPSISQYKRKDSLPLSCQMSDLREDQLPCWGHMSIPDPVVLGHPILKVPSVGTVIQLASSTPKSLSPSLTLCISLRPESQDYF